MFALMRTKVDIMLKEKIFYKDGIPVNAMVANVREYPIHFHNDLEIAYVLAGTITLKNGYYTYTLKQGDIYILNDKEIHSYYSTGEDNIVMILQLDVSYFSNYYDNFKNCFFATDMENETDENLDILRELSVRIVMEMLQKENNYQDKVIESAHNLICCLMSDFRCFTLEDGKFINEISQKNNKVLAGRLHRITDYMYENYKRKLTLGEIAKREQLSVFYLSHAIKASTGVSFQELLNFIRVEESEKLLLGTNKKIGVIAEECGFSAVRYYIKHFEKWFELPPAEYREKYTDKVSSHEVSAVMELCGPDVIEEAIKNQAKKIYNEYIIEGSYKPEIFEVNISECAEMTQHESEFPEEIFEKEVMKAAARPFNLFKSLNENILFSNRNCMVSTSASNAAPINNLSIFVFNCEDEFHEKLEEPIGKENFLESLKTYDSEAEMIIRCTGVSGGFRIVRYKMTKQNVISACEEWTRATGTLNKRQALLNSWSSLPNIEVGEVVVSDTLNLRVKLRGLSAELILIDRK